MDFPRTAQATDISMFRAADPADPDSCTDMNDELVHSIVTGLGG
jgi:hypothetical protein